MPRRGATDRGRRPRRGEPRVRALPGDAARVPAPLHRDDRPVGARRTATAIYAALILAWTTLPLDPREVHELGLERLRGDPGGARRDRRPPRVRERGRGDRRRIRRAERTPPAPATSCWRSLANRSSGAGTPPARSSGACRTTTATSARSRSSASRTRRSASTTRRPRTDRAAARTTSTRPTCPAGRCTTSRASRITRRTPAIISSSRSSRRSPTGPRCGGSAASSRAARSRKGGACTASAWPTRWACTWTTGNGWACSKRRACAPRASSPTRGSTRSGGRASSAIDSMEAIGTPHVDAVIEIDRYIAIPAQALSYMIGMIEIERARRTADRARGRGVLAPRLPRPAARARSAAAPGAPPRAGLSAAAVEPARRGLHSPHHPSAQQRRCSVLNVDIRFSPSFAMANVKLAQGDSVAGGGRRDDRHDRRRRDRDEGAGRTARRPEAIGARRRELLHQHVHARARAGRGHRRRRRFPATSSTCRSRRTARRSWCSRARGSRARRASTVDTKWGGAKTFFSGEGLFMLRCSGGRRHARGELRRDLRDGPAAPASPTRSTRATSSRSRRASATR